MFLLKPILPIRTLYMPKVVAVRTLVPIAFSVYMAVFGFCVISIQAETIQLGNGQTIEGKIVEETDEYIRVMDGAGFISKYPRLEVEAINPAETPSLPTPEPAAAQQQPEQQMDKAQGAVDKVRAQLQENLKQTEAMVKDTLNKLYALPEYQATFGDNKESDDVTGKRASDRLQMERDRKYKKHKKYY